MTCVNVIASILGPSLSHTVVTVCNKKLGRSLEHSCECCAIALLPYYMH